MSKAATTIGTAVFSIIAPAMNAVADKLNARNSEEDVTGAQLMGFLEEALGTKPTTSPAAPKESKAKTDGKESAIAAATSSTCTFKAPRAKKECGKPTVDGTDRCEDCAKTSAEKPKPPTAAKKPSGGKTLPFTTVGKGGDAKDAEADGEASVGSDADGEGETAKPEPAKEPAKAAPKKAAATKAAPKPKEPEPVVEDEPAAKETEKPKPAPAKAGAKAAAPAKAGDSKDKAPEVATSKSLIDKMKAKQVEESAKTQDVDDLAAGATSKAAPAKSGTTTAAKPAAPKGAAPKAPASTSATSKAAPKAAAKPAAPKGGKAPAKKPVDEDEPSGDEGSGSQDA